MVDVLAFHPRHGLTLSRLAVEDIARIVDELEWIAVYKCRGTQEGIKYMQINLRGFHPSPSDIYLII